MRLSDGMIYETEYGFWIRQELGNYASCQVITWTSLFFLDKNMINALITHKIEENQRKLNLYVSREAK